MNLRIHGDNIIECERTLRMIQQAYETQSLPLAECVYFPSFLLNVDGVGITIELFAGHDRWRMSIAVVVYCSAVIYSAVRFFGNDSRST